MSSGLGYVGTVSKKKIFIPAEFSTDPKRAAESTGAGRYPIL